MDELVPAPDVLIVGSGPVGATFARVLFEQSPAARIEMVDLGPQLTPVAGLNVRNLADHAARDDARRRSQGPAGARPSVAHVRRLARPGTHLLQGDAGGMPAAAHSSNVGGMGAHWSCATPRPAGTERIPVISDAEWGRVVARAEGLLWTTRTPFPATADTHKLLEKLGGCFDPRLPGPRNVAPMPLACVPSIRGGPIWWAGGDSVLGPLAQPEQAASARFTLRSETVCQRLLTEDRQVTGAVLHHLPTGTSQMISARIVVVAADALRTPQLLWASGIRPPALGHYLNDQPQLIATASPARRRQPAAGGFFWVPFDDAGHPYHGQVMQFDATSLALLDGGDPEPDAAPRVVLTWFCRKELHFEDRVEFSADDVDSFGLPTPAIKYALTPGDVDAIEGATLELELAAASLGGFVDEPTLLPAGSSLHYQGTVRMGKHEDGASVCDSCSRVWGLENLYVGGNGVIPTATACNPTLSSVALAVRAAERIAQTIRS